MSSNIFVMGCSYTRCKGTLLEKYILFLLLLILSEALVASDYVQQRSNELFECANTLEMQFRRNQEDYQRLMELFEWLMLYDRWRDSLPIATSYSEVVYRTGMHYDAENILSNLECQKSDLENKQQYLWDQLYFLRDQVAALRNV